MAADVLRLESNSSGRDFVVGDLHGCLKDLSNLLKSLEFDPVSDRLFCTGDLIDRGPDSIGCLELIYEPWFFSIRGNHEEMMVYSIKNPQQHSACGNWVANGGAWHFEQDQNLLAHLVKKIEELPLAICVRGAVNFNIVHAEFFGDDEELMHGDFSEATQAVMQWGRDIHNGNRVSKLKIQTYVGHTIVKKFESRGALNYIDTGCFLKYWEGYDGHLTMVQPQ